MERIFTFVLALKVFFVTIVCSRVRAYERRRSSNTDNEI